MACSERSADSKGLERLCGFYRQLGGPAADRMSDLERYQAIQERVTAELGKEVLARQAWEAAANAVPAQRYEAFKFMVDQEIGKPFDCPAMKTYF